jgi:hypothetical protein
MVNGCERFQPSEGAVRADDLTKSQCAALRNQVGRIVAYLYRLNRRMGEKGFPPDDQLKRLVENSQKTIGELHMELVGRSIDGMGWQARNEKPPEIDPLFTRTSKPRKHERRDG